MKIRGHQNADFHKGMPVIQILTFINCNNIEYKNETV
jgi:hypothetical protein